MAEAKKNKKKGGKYSSIKGAGRFSKSTLDKVYRRGLGAYLSSGSRNTSMNAWSMGRVNSYMTGKGGARKADAAIYKKYQKRRSKA